jgi:hypothetical protein
MGTFLVVPGDALWVPAAYAGASDSAAGDAGQNSDAGSPTSDQPTPSPKNSASPTGVKRTREKEAEGTEARDRFKADTVIKSKYKLDGEPLEVDPD